MLPTSFIDLLAWIFFGLVAGFLVNLVMPTTGGLFATMILGIIGAIFGGWLMGFLNATLKLNLPTATGPDSFNLSGLIVAVIGALIVILIYRKVFKG